MMNIEFKNKIALITGAGQGLGKEYATLIAARGGIVIVNDKAKDSDGHFLAKKLALELKEKGFCAYENYDDISTESGVVSMMDFIKMKFNRIDVFIHNAGIMINKPFLSYHNEDWFQVINVHLNAAFYLLRSVVPIMIDNNYGRIVLITSSVGMYGLANHVNYGTAKMGIVGLMQSLKDELQNYNINTNVVSPLAMTNLTQSAMGLDDHEMYNANMVAPMVAYLSSSESKENGMIISAGGGAFSRVAIFESRGVVLKKEHMSIENVALNVKDITDMNQAVQVNNIKQAAMKLMRSISRKNK